MSDSGRIPGQHPSVLHVTPYYPPDRIGGVGEAARLIHIGLMERGYRSEVLTSGLSQSNPSVHRIAGSPVGLFLRSWIGVRLARGFDVVHVHHGEAVLLLLLLRVLPRRPALLLMFHVDVKRLTTSASPHVVAGRRYGLPRRREFCRRLIGFGKSVLDRLSYMLADHVVVETKCVRRELSELRPQKQVTVIPYGLPSADKKAVHTVTHAHILYVGTPGFRKRTHLLPLLLRLVHRDHPEARLRVVGFRAEDDPEMLREAERLHVLDSIEFVGGITSEEVVPYYSAASVLVVPSAYEGLPMVLLEGMRSGLCCVATDVSGHPEAIDNGVNGLLVPLDDVGALAESCVWAIDNPQSARELGAQAARTVLERFSVEQQTGSYASLYRDLMKASVP